MLGLLGWGNINGDYDVGWLGMKWEVNWGVWVDLCVVGLVILYVVVGMNYVFEDCS